MLAEPEQALGVLHRAYIEQYPAEASRVLEQLPAAQGLEILGALPLKTALPVWERLVPDIAAHWLTQLPQAQLDELLQRANPNRSAAWLASFEPERQRQLLSQLDATVARELSNLLSFPPDSAGALMDPRVLQLRPQMSVREALQRLRGWPRKDLRHIFLVDDDTRLAGVVAVQALALAGPAAQLESLMQPVTAVVNALASREEVVAMMDNYRLTDLPVVDLDGQLIGVVRTYSLLVAVENEASAKLQTMVGVGKEERALSKVSFSVRKRLPWLQINLLTAFLAASVVGFFESTIAQFTALAVLLPVVAGQSGNTGAQALAVTMRALALREIGIRHWRRLLLKEASVGLFNGVTVALVTATGVWVWSGSQGLALVICVAMVLSMVIAGVAGAAIPLILQSLDQDPAQSSSILLTTVTDIAGFFSFLGIATLLAGIL
ncbi:magnesium transporter [Marinobacterium arenosum]|uniref:magnesium transporter n=1 Tax=Marinobacterium arenosum TaxID=2862496 RepID=UPI001C9823E7|nr:magnesium transporter [Marinobacterium arenosum]MBY4676091.1 magnesium transporter [Marinobacterium arenosum]